MRFLYRATFTDGTNFEQPQDDSSKLLPGEKSSKHDILEHMKGRELATIELLDGAGPWHFVYRSSGSLEIRNYEFKAHGEFRPGEALPEGCEWIEGDPAQGVYFRRVRRHFNTGMEEVAFERSFCIGLAHAPGVKNFLAVRE